MGACRADCFGILTSAMEKYGQGIVSVDCGCILREDPDTVRFR